MKIEEGKIYNIEVVVIYGKYEKIYVNGALIKTKKWKAK